MPTQTVEFRFYTGLKRKIFRNPRLRGSWDANGLYSDQWTAAPMVEEVGEDGCPLFRGSVELDLAGVGRTFKWGVVLDGPQGANFWGIPTEVQDVNSTDRYRTFQLQPGGAGPQVETYYFTYGRRLGANKHFAAGNAKPGLRFAVWAPNAQKVEVVFGDAAGGYIYNDGTGIDPARPAVGLQKGAGGIWESDPQADFAAFEGVPYMYRIVNAQGETVYRTDIFSRSQIGRGAIDPEPDPPGVAPPWPGTPDTLDGPVSCSVVLNPDTILRDFPTVPGGHGVRVPADEFWASELTPGLPVPRRVQDLVIYELHVGALGFGGAKPGDLADAVAFLDHLMALGVNAVELLPMAESTGNMSWGYGDTHHLVIQSSAGGRSEYQHFVRECHRRGIAVIQDVVYNHYDYQSKRAEWKYDSTAPEQNIYYWYEGRAADYPNDDGGYLNNGSSGYAPRYWEEVVRQQFISAAAFLIEELHVDGLRVDLTEAIHRNNALNANGSQVGSANVFGQKLLREWSRTLNMIQPSVMLIAEDHSGWDAVTKPPAAGGLGFDATWYAEFYHNLVGDANQAEGNARLLKEAGMGGSEPLALDTFAGSLAASQFNKIVYHESHDEAGNDAGTTRTMVAAVNGAPIWGATRVAAEARSRVAFGLSLLSAGTPMFFMAEEVGAQKPYTFDGWFGNREDILGDKAGVGSKMFLFYQEIITVSRRLQSTRSGNIAILHASNDNRVMAIKRWGGGEEVIILASLNNTPFDNGYAIQSDLLSIPNAGWKEIFNSDAAIYGGSNIGNAGTAIQSTNGRLQANIPANGLVILVRQ